jgi:dihydroxy-acid dehydratase
MFNTVRRLHLRVSEAELARRASAWAAPKPVADRGYASMYVRHVQQVRSPATNQRIIN